MGNRIGRRKRRESFVVRRQDNVSRSPSSMVSSDADDENNTSIRSDEARAVTTGEEAMGFWRGKSARKRAAAERQNGPKGKRLTDALNSTLKSSCNDKELARLVQAPSGERAEDWIAVNTVHFYNAVNMIFGACASFCVSESPGCEVMSAGPRYEYLWKDPKTKKSLRVSAPEHIEMTLQWIHAQLQDRTLFPQPGVEISMEYAPDFFPRVREIFKRILRIYAHLYRTHFTRIRELGAHPHLNTCFKHFMFFVLEFDLVDAREMRPLRNLINRFAHFKEPATS